MVLMFLNCSEELIPPSKKLGMYLCSVNCVSGINVVKSILFVMLMQLHFIKCKQMRLRGGVDHSC